MTDMSLEKAPVAAEAAHGHGHDHFAERSNNLKLAMWLLLASEVVIFATIISVYVVFRVGPDGSKVVEQVHEIIREWPGIWLVTINTFLLLTSSWCMVMGLREIQRDNRQGLIRWIMATAVLGIVFVALQYVEYTELSHNGIALFNQGNELDGFGMRFYAPTAFHGAHVIVGVLWALFVAWNAKRGNYSAKNYAGVEVFGLYWHFVDVVWIVLFTVIYLV